MHHDDIHDIQEARRVIQELIQERDEYAQTGWLVPSAGRTRRLINQLPPGKVCVGVGDISHLKQLNSATGYQPRTDELFHPALKVRVNDIYFVLGKRDEGDQFILIASNAREIAARIDAELQAAPMTDEERVKYVRGVCIKRWGPWIGRIVAAMGWHTIPAYPRIDWQFEDDVEVNDIVCAANRAEKQLFITKSNNLKVV